VFDSSRVGYDEWRPFSPEKGFVVGVVAARSDRDCEAASPEAGGGVVGLPMTVQTVGRKIALTLTETISWNPALSEVSDPDARLMLQVRDGNAAAFEELVLRYQARLITVLHNLVHDRDRAEELAQDVFLRVFRARSSYEPHAKFSTWIFTIAHHVASNALRSKSRRREVNVAAEQSGEQVRGVLDNLATAPSAQMPTRQLDKAEIGEVVRAAIDALNERQRMALLLAKFEHMNYADIAATMGLTIQAVKSLLARARDNLRLILQPYVQEGARP
jgi:RNA polymerase sigma-70 factor, ECF subfamily